MIIFVRFVKHHERDPAVLANHQLLWVEDHFKAQNMRQPDEAIWPPQNEDRRTVRGFSSGGSIPR